MTQVTNERRALRLLALGLIIGLSAYWAGSRYGQRIPAAVDAVRATAAGEANLDPTEAENVRIYKLAAPAVANIVTRTVEYDFFFNPVPVEGAGSGFVIDADGHILTNYHVVQGAQTIEVTLGDQSRYKAKYIGADTTNDIALIQIDPKGHKVAPLTLGDSRTLQVGQRVLAIGNPFGFQSTLTTGVVSSLGRTVQTDENTLIDEAPRGRIQADGRARFGERNTARPGPRCRGSGGDFSPLPARIRIVSLHVELTGRRRRCHQRSLPQAAALPREIRRFDTVPQVAATGGGQPMY